MILFYFQSLDENSITADEVVHDENLSSEDEKVLTFVIHL